MAMKLLTILIPTLWVAVTSNGHNVTEEVFCDVDILLFDLFGDGWGNTVLLVNVEGVTHNVTFNCGHCDGISFPSAFCNVSVQMSSPGLPITPWENYWVVGIGGQRFAGGFDSRLVVENGNIFGENLINDTDSLQCEECSHPKENKGKGGKDGKGKGGKKGKSGKGRKGGKGKRSLSGKLSKGKSNPVSENTQLFDEQSNGWFYHSGWNDVCDLHNCAPGDGNCTTSLPNIPNGLIYPRYFILTADKTELLHEGTICSNEKGYEVCANNLPKNGDFVFRVAGIEPQSDSATWDFCDTTGGINEELQFKMKDGECKPGLRISANQVCEGLMSNVEMTGSLLLSGVISEFFTALDANVLENDLKLVMPANAIAIKSWTNVDNGLRVHFSATFLSDFDMVYYHSNVEKLVSTIQSDLSASIESGVFKEQMKNALDALPNTQTDVLRYCTEIILEDIVLYSAAYIDANGATHNTPYVEVVSSPIDNTVSSPQGTTYTITSRGVYALVTVGIIILGIAAVVVKRMSQRKSHEPLPTDSLHAASP